MSGLCKNCMFKGDVEKCKPAICGQHESWYGVTQQATIEAQAAEIAELKTGKVKRDVVFHRQIEELADLQKTVRKKSKQLTQANDDNKELRKAIQAIDDIVYEECDAGMMGQIWAIIEDVREVK